MDLDIEDYFALSRQLEQHHALFYSVWNLGVPKFTDEIETAAIKFDEAGEQIEFLFNPKYWESLDEYTRIFVICHECLHVILHHGYRIKDTKDEETRKLCNYSLDVVVNHSLVNHFGFQRTKVQGGDKLCWTDTVFPGQTVPDNESFEYYFIRLAQTQQNPPPNSSGGLDKLKMPDDHGMMAQSDWSDAIKKVSDSSSNQSKQSLQGFIEKHYQKPPNEMPNEGGMEAGDTSLGKWEFAAVDKVKKKKKWETVIKKWAKRYDVTDLLDIEQWARVHRRLSMLGGDLMLPSDMESEVETEGKIEVWFFQDTSGSCAQYRDRFFTAAMSLPKKRFKIRLFCFDTKVYETTLESKKLYGFGGTAFHIIEEEIQKRMKSEKCAYPKAVFIITDGYGTTVKPSDPKVWYVFLTGNHRDCFSKECNFFHLRDYE